MLAFLKLQTSLRSFTPSMPPWTSSHPRTSFVKSRLFPCWEPRTFAEWEVDIMRCALRLDMEGIEMRSMIQKGRVREVSIYERTQKGASGTEEEEYVLVEIVNTRGGQICLLKFEREGIAVQVKKSVGWGVVKDVSSGEASNIEQSTTKRASSAPAEFQRTPPLALDVQKKRARSNGSRGPAHHPAHGPIPVMKQTITCRDTVVSTRVSRSDKVKKIIQFDQNGPRVLDLFVALSTIDKCEEAMRDHGRGWFAGAFVGIMQGAFEERRVLIRKDPTAVANGGPFGKEQRKKVDVNEVELRMFLEEFTAHRARSILNLQAWDEAIESEAPISRRTSGKKRDIARQDIWLEREIEFRKDAEAEAWRRMYKSLDAVEEARAKLHRAEADREEAEIEREKAEKSRKKAVARFADVLAEKERLGHLM